MTYSDEKFVYGLTFLRGRFLLFFFFGDRIVGGACFVKNRNMVSGQLL